MTHVVPAITVSLMLALVRLGRHSTKTAQDIMVARVLAVMLFRESTTTMGTKSNVMIRPAAAKRAKDSIIEADSM